MTKNRCFFRIRMSRGLSAVFFIMGLTALLIGLDMGFLHLVIPLSEQSSDGGYIFGQWFLIIVGVLVSYSGGSNLISPMVMLEANREGIGIKTRPGFSRTLTRIPWSEIDDIREGKIRISSGHQSNAHRSIKIVLRPDSQLPKSSITDATVHWHRGEIDLDSSYFRESLDLLIQVLKILHENPERYLEVNGDFASFQRKYPL